MSSPITPLNELRIYPEPNSGCWLWIGNVDAHNYGRYWCKHLNRDRPAHRVVWESHHGPIPEGLEIDHLCRTTCCVNPAHLEPVTRSINTKRGINPKLTSDRHKAITHCPQGHEYTPENTLLRPRSGHRPWSGRQCRACDRIRAAKYRAKRLLSEAPVPAAAQEGSK